MTTENNINARTLSSINPHLFIDGAYKLQSGLDYNKILLPLFQIIKEYEDENKAYGTTVDTHNFLSSTLAYYKQLLLMLENITRFNLGTFTTYRRANVPVNVRTFREFIIASIQLGVKFEPVTKMFLEDLYKLLYKNSNVSLNRYTEILSKPFRDYTVGTKTLSISLTPEDTSYVKDKKEIGLTDITLLFSKLGTKGTIDTLKMLLAVYLNVYFLHNQNELNGLLTPLTQWRVPYFRGTQGGIILPLTMGSRP